MSESPCLVVDMPADDGLRRRAAAWVVEEWPHLFPDDTEEWYLDVWADADTSGTDAPHAVVALLDGEVVGTASMVLDDELPGAPEPGPWIAAVWVHPDHRRKGAGRAMVRELMSRAGGRLWLYTENEADWYVAMGWAPVRDATLNGHTVTVMTWCS
ncbi:MAG: GNAT family N-acetyltransferase [Acidimicrobiales bacterium]